MAIKRGAIVGIILLLFCGVGLLWAQDQGTEATPVPEATPAPEPTPPAEPAPPPAEPAPVVEPPAVEEAPAANLEEPSSAEDENAKSKFDLNGFIQSQAGIFTSFYQNRVDEAGYPVEHGGLWGEPSMFRNTLQLEATYQPVDQVALFCMFRGVRSASLRADRFAQFPEMYADTSFNYNQYTQDAKRKAVAEAYYQEADFRELYVDIYPTNWWTLRIGRQQVAWGESANARLMDVINPVDSTWHLSAWEAYEDQRVPLWMGKTVFDISPINASIEGVVAPMVDDPRNTVNIPLTFVGAWGLPVSPKNEYLSGLQVVKKHLVAPETELSDTRWGARWKHVIGPFTYGLMYYHGHHLSPPIQQYAEQTQTPNEEGYREVEIYLYFPMQEHYGLSWELITPQPVSTIFRFEGTYLPGWYYPVNSYLSPGIGDSAKHTRGWYQSPENSDKFRADFWKIRKDTYNYGITIQRPNQIRWLNPTGSIILQMQYIQTIIPDGPYIDEELANGDKKENKNWYATSITGYDTTKIDEIQSMYTIGILTSYARGLVSPTIIGVYDENSNSGFVSTQLDFAFGDHWRIKAAYNFIEGEHPYEGLGLFRDRDEANLRVRYQF